MHPVRQNSTDKIRVGPVMSTAGAIVTTLDISTADSAKAVLDDDSVVDISTYIWAATTADGEYDLTLQTGITDTVGRVDILIEDADLCLPVPKSFHVLDPVVYDALYGASPTLLTANDIGQLYESAITTVNTQLSYDMVNGITSDDVWIGCIVTIKDVSTGEPFPTYVTDVDQANDRILVKTAPPFTVVAGDVLRVESRIHPAYALEAYDMPTRAEATTDKNAILNKLLSYVQLLARSDAFIATDKSAELNEINTDEGSGAGNYDNLFGSIEQIGGNSTAIVADTNELQTDWADGGRLDTILDATATSAEVAAVDAVTAAEVWAELLGTTGESASAILQVIASAVSGKLSGAATSTITIRNIQDTADVIVATVDADGNRSAVSITYPAD